MIVYAGPGTGAGNQSSPKELVRRECIFWCCVCVLRSKKRKSTQDRTAAGFTLIYSQSLRRCVADIFLPSVSRLVVSVFVGGVFLFQFLIFFT